MKKRKQAIAFCMTVILLSTFLPFVAFSEGNAEANWESSVPVEPANVPAPELPAETRNPSPLDFLAESENASPSDFLAAAGNASPPEPPTDAGNASTPKPPTETRHASATEFPDDAPELPDDEQANLQSMMPLQEIYLDDVDLSGRFKMELAQTPIRDLLPDVEIPDSGAIVWAEEGSDDYTVSAPTDTIDLSDYVSDYDDSFETMSFELIVGSPHQLDRTNVRYIVTAGFSAPLLEELLQVDAVYASEERGDIGIRNRSVDDDADIQEYCLSVDKTWTGEPVFLSFHKTETADANLDATIYEGAYESLEEIQEAGEEAVDITARIWDKSAVLKTADADALYSADCDPDEEEGEFPRFTIVWKRGETPISVVPLFVSIQPDHENISFSFRDAEGDSISYETSRYDKETKFRTYYYMVERRGQKYTDNFFLRAWFIYHGERMSYSEYGIKAVASNRTYETYQQALADSGNVYDVTDVIFSEQGYEADYSKGIVFTFFDREGNRFVVRGVQTLVRESIRFSNLIKAGDSEFQPRRSGDNYYMPSAAYSASDPYFITVSYQRDYENADYYEHGIHVTAGPEEYSTYGEALSNGGFDVTNLIFSPAGYSADFSGGVTFSVFNAQGEQIDYLTVKTLVRESIQFSNLIKAGDSEFQPRRSGNNYYMPSAAYPANGLYFITASYQREYEDADYYEYGIHVTAGPERYDTYGEALSSGGFDVTNLIFSPAGYSADFSEGVAFSVFNAQGERIASRTVKTVAYSADENTYFRVTGARRGAEGSGEGSYNAYFMPDTADSYYANGYQTVFLLDGQDAANASAIYPTFSKSSMAKIFAELNQTSGEEQVSGVSPVAFNPGGPTEVKYSAASESGTRLQNYWVTFVTKLTGQARLFVNAESRLDPGSLLPMRELVLTQRNGAYHDVFFANVGDQNLTGISVSLKDAQNVALDPYWTVRENATDNARTLSGFTTTDKSSYRDADDNLLDNDYGELANTAKIRIHPSNPDVVGPISGSLLINTANGGSREIKLTGVVGDIRITTETIRDGVQYVPYFTTIGTNNMYDPAAVRFELVEGGLPDGFELYPNGVIYGVTKEPGEYDFSVKATFTYGGEVQSSDEADFTLLIKDNSNANVDAETNDPEYGYPIKTYIPDIIIYVDESGGTTAPQPSADPNQGSSGLVQIFYGYHDALLVSEGDEDEFIDLWLDGERLELGVDYFLDDPGSTPVHAASSLWAKTSPGSHTFAMEFWTGGKKNEGKMKQTSQNVYLQKNGASYGNQNNSSSQSQNSSTGSNTSSPRSKGVTSYAIHVSKNKNGTIKLSRSAAPKGQTVTVTVTPNGGYAVRGVSVKGTNVAGDIAVYGEGGTYTFTMPGKQVTVSASIEPTAPTAYPIHVDAVSGGQLRVSHASAVPGTRVTVTAQPASGYVLDDGSVKVRGTNVAGNVAVTGSGNNYSFIMPGKQVTITAQFIVDRFLTFTDVKGTDWFFDDVKWAYNKGLMLGITDEYYEPESLISSVTAIVTLARLTPDLDLSRYEGVSVSALGVDDNEWYTRELLWARDAGLLLDGPFPGRAPIARGQFALMLEKYLNYQGIQTEFNWESAQSLVYEENMTDNQVRAFQILRQADIFRGGIDGRMYPSSYTTRANLAALLHRMSNYIIQYWQSDLEPA